MRMARIPVLVLVVVGYGFLGSAWIAGDVLRFTSPPDSLTPDAGWFERRLGEGLGIGVWDRELAGE